MVKSPGAHDTSQDARTARDLVWVVGVGPQTRVEAWSHRQR